MAIEKFVTVATIERCALADDFSSIPAHITLCPPFQVEAGRIFEYHERMSEVIDENPRGIHVIATEPQWFGADYDVSATKTWVSLIDGGFSIHYGALAGARAIGAQLDDKFAGMRWNPHSSKVDDLSLPGAPFWLTDVQLFRYRPDGMKRVIGIYAADAVKILEEEKW